MAITSHGHHIPGTSSDNEEYVDTARCGGVTFCAACIKEANEMTVDLQSSEVWVKKVRRIPIEVEAVHWVEGTPMKVLKEFTNHLVRMDDVNMFFTVYDRIDDKWNRFGYGDWIIKGVSGNFFPCPHADFIANFEN